MAGRKPLVRWARSVLLAALLASPVSDAATRAEETDPSTAGGISLSLRDLQGRIRSLEEYRGRIVILNFWATWCLPCLEEMPLLSGIRDAYEARGVEVVAVSADGPATRERVPEFVRRHGMSFPVWVGATVDEMRSLGLGSALPATALVDPEGRIAFRVLGPVTREILEERLDFLLGDDGPAPERVADSLAVPHDEEPRHDDPFTGGDHHDHEGGAAHEHGGAGPEGDSLVPS